MSQALQARPTHEVVDPCPTCHTDHAGHCSAHSSRTGKACRSYPINGAVVCVTHGGSAPQVIEAARRRIAGPILQAAVERHEKLIVSGRNEAAVGAMIRDTYDRVGIGTEARGGDVEVRELLIRVRHRIERGTGPEPATL